MQAEYDSKMKEKKQQCEFKSVRKEISKAVLLRSQMKESRSVRSLSGLQAENKAHFDFRAQ